MILDMNGNQTDLIILKDKEGQTLICSIKCKNYINDTCSLAKLEVTSSSIPLCLSYEEKKEEFQWSKIDYLVFPFFVIVFIVLWLMLIAYEPTLRRINK